MATSTPTTKEGWLALAQHYRDNATDYEGYPHDSWEYSQYTYWIGQAEYAEEQAAKFNMGGGGSSDPKLITGTSGDDSIVNRIAGAIIQALGGNDKIENSGASVSIDGGAGTDTIDNNADYVTIIGGAGDDKISNGVWYGSSRCSTVSIEAGAGNDTIFNIGSSVTINAGEGNDLISLSSSGSQLIIYNSGSGNDSIVGFSETSTLDIAGSSYSTKKSGSDIIVTVDDSKITLKGAASLSSAHIQGSLKSGSSSDINPSGGSSSYNIIRGTWSADSIENTLKSVEIQAYGGNDTVRNGSKVDYNGGSRVTIIGGTGNDYIDNCSYGTMIEGGSGNDYVYNHGDSYLNYIWDNRSGGYEVRINAGTGNDTIKNEVSGVTITGGEGDDLILLDAQEARHNLILYNVGDGNDSITGFNNTSTLRIDVDSDAYSTVVSGSDIIVTGGKVKITLVGAATLDNLNIEGLSWKLIGTTATYGTSNNTLVTVNGVKSLDGISLIGTKVTLSEAALGTDNVTISDGYKLALGKNVTKSSKTKAWSLNKTTATYEQTTTAGYTLADNVITYVPKSVDTLATVEGVKAVDGLKISGKTITVSAASLNKKNVTVSDGYTLKLGTDVTKSSKTKAWSLSKTTATYKQTTTAGYTLADNVITYSPKSIETLATVKGVKAVDGLKVSGKTITVSEASLNKKNVTVSDGYTLKLGSDVTKPITKKAAWNLSGSTATYKSSYKTAGYTLADNQISYAKATTATNLATVKGAKSADGLSVSGSKITLKNAALANKVTVSGGYEFDFAKDYTNATITGSKNNDTITARGTKVLINAGAGDDTIKMLGSTITVKGGSGNDLFVYSTGNNVIADYETGDKISIGAAISSSSFKDTDATFKIGSKTLTVKNGKGKEITFIDVSGTERTIIGGAYLVPNNTSSKVTLTASREVGDATARTNPIRLTGNAKDNTILGGSNDDSLYGGAGNDSLMGNAGNDLLSGGSGDDYVIGGDGNDKLYGYSGNDTLIGGAGNDSLWGQAGADTFVYSNGNDIIYGFDDNDMLTLDGIDFTASVENDAVKFTVNDGSIILKDFTATTFHVNGDTYAISNNKFVKQ